MYHGDLYSYSYNLVLDLHNSSGRLKVPNANIVLLTPGLNGKLTCDRDREKGEDSRELGGGGGGASLSLVPALYSLSLTVSTRYKQQQNNTNNNNHVSANYNSIKWLFSTFLTVCELLQMFLRCMCHACKRCR